MNKFSVEEQYQVYLEKSGLNEAQMGEHEREGRRMTFYAAWGQLLLLLKNEMGSMQGPQRDAQVDDMLEEVLLFWTRHL